MELKYVKFVELCYILNYLLIAPNGIEIPFALCR